MRSSNLRLRWWRVLMGGLLLTSSLGLLGGAQAMVQATSVPTVLQNAQLQFVQALQQAGAIGSAESNVQGAWTTYVRALNVYAGTSQAWLMGAQPLTALLNRGSAPLSFQVTDTSRGASRVRTILVSDHQVQGYGPFICVGPPERYPLYAAQIMITTSPAGSTQSSVMGQIVNDHDSSAYTSVPSVYDAFDRAYSWTTPDRVRHMVTITHTLCGGSGGDFPHLVGLRQGRGQRFWSYDSAMFPQDPFQNPTLMLQQAHFMTPTGSVIRLDAAFQSSVISECNACLHVFGSRLLRRVGTVYQMGPWTLTLSPYLTLVQAVSAAEKAQQGGVNECSSDTLTGLVATNRAAQSFCAVMWAGVGNVSVVHGADNLFPPYKPGATVLSVATSSGDQNLTYLVTMTPSAGAWVISDVRRT